MSHDTVVLDLGGVLIDWDPRYLYRRLLPDDEVEAFLDEIGFAEWNAGQDSGRRDWAEAVEHLAEQHPHRRGLIAAYPQRFGETLAGPIDGTVAVVEELHERGVPLLALTNWSAETFRVARAMFGFLDLFGGIVVSGEEGVAKPDPRLFRILLDRYDLDPGRTVFVDDSPTNVATARDVGMTSLRFTSPGALRGELVGMGLLPAAR